MRIIFIGLLFLSSSVLFGQEQEPAENKRDKVLALINEGDFEKAIVLLEDALKEYPENNEAEYLLGYCHFSMNHYELANKSFDKVLEKYPQYTNALFFKALILNHQNKPEMALELFLKANQLDPADERILVELARTYNILKNPEKAAKTYRDLIKINPKSIVAHYNLAGILLEQDIKEAIRHYEEILIINPHQVDTLYSLGQVYQNQDQPKESLVYFLKALEASPADWNALTKTIQLYQSLERLDRRDAAIKKLKKMKEEGGIKNLGEAEFYIRDQFVISDVRVFALEYFELKGKKAVKYSFLVNDKEKNENLYKISLGSYEFTNQVARELGELKEGERRYHLDYYSKDQRERRTYGFFNGEPDYDEIRKMVTDAVKGELKAISATYAPK